MVVGIGSVPNSELFRETLVLSKDGGILTDSSLRTSHPSGDVFAAGDVACAPVPLGGNDERNFMTAAIRSQHVKAARDMGTFAARTMLAGSDTGDTYNPVPHMYSRSVLTAVDLQCCVQRPIIPLARRFLPNLAVPNLSYLLPLQKAFESSWFVE